ncbi:MAG: hypothetical protein JWP00_4190 [Chloroflexi bacterium]|nr:hypothetical protein [Chloroflexota bacterium]
MKYISLVMVRENMAGLPSFQLPEGYKIRTFVKGDEHLWAKIEKLAGEFDNEERALEHFQKEFGPFVAEMEDRCFILEDPQGEAIGTATAWYGTFENEIRGRVHWVGIVPGYQGKKLSKPLLGAVMMRLAAQYQKAYLTTQTKSYRAVNMYLDFGFVPYNSNDSYETYIEGWQLMEGLLDRKISF